MVLITSVVIDDIKRPDGVIYRRITDIETGEILTKCYIESPTLPGQMFPKDKNVSIKEVLLMKEQLPSGKWLITFENIDYDEPEIFCRTILDKNLNIEDPNKKKKWRGTGGQKKYLKLYSDELQKLSDDEKGFLISISKFLDWKQGFLIHKGRHLKRAELMKLLSYPSTTFSRKFNKLLDQNVIYLRGESIRVNQQYINRGNSKGES